MPATSPAAGRSISTAQYQERLTTVNAVDFGDLLLHNLTLLTGNPDILADYQRRFRYLLVDEYQDTNVAQYLWLRLLGPAAPQSVLRRRRRSVDLQLARRRDRQHPALRDRLSRRDDHPARAELPLDLAHPRCRGRNDRAEPRAARQDAMDRGERRRQGRGARGLGREWMKPAGSARRSRRCSAEGHALSEVAILVRAGFQTREFEERFISWHCLIA